MLDAEKISIVEFKIIKGQIESPFDFDLDIVEGHDFKVNFNLSFNIESKLAKTDFEISITTKSIEKQEEVNGFFHFIFVYKVENLEILTLVKNKEIQVDENLGSTLAAITYSTVRGILMTRFQGTALDDFILPIINSNKLVD